MSELPDLEYYGDTYSKMSMEGEGYYVTYYESPSHFDSDPELKAAFVKAGEGMNSFKSLLEKRIVDKGGDPENYMC